MDYVVYHLNQVDLDKKLYGGIILTGGGAQLKHIIQLTEYITGLGARIGYPNEHLAGGHADQLMNPMYSTCIGLILRGYHDYENGRMRFVGEGGNIIHNSFDEPISLATISTSETPAAHSAPVIEDEPVTEEERKRKEGRRAKKFTNLFDGLKGKFMRLFEEEEEDRIID